MKAKYLNSVVQNATRLGEDLLVSVGATLQTIKKDGAVANLVTLEAPILALTVDDQGRILVAVGRNIIRLNGTGQGRETLYISPATLSNPKLVSKANILVIVETRKVTIIKPGQAPFIRAEPSGTTFQDAEIDIPNNYVYLVGWYDRKRNNVPVQIACFRAYNLDTLRWSGVWNYNAATLGNDMADTRLYKVQLFNGMVYVAGETAGGNTIFRWNGKDLNATTMISGDKYQHAYQTRSNHITYVGVIDPKGILVPGDDEGNKKRVPVLRGSLYLPRQNNNDAGTVRVRSLTVNQNGLFVGGVATFAIPQRDTLFLGKKEPYRGGDASLLSLNFDLTRKTWLTPGHSKTLLSYDERYAVTLTDARCDLGTTEGTCQGTDNTYLVIF